MAARKQSFQWVRLWKDLTTDPKWRTIARVSGQRMTDVVAIYVHMMTLATNATERGHVEGFNAEDVAALFDIDVTVVQLITDAMQGRVLDGNYLTGWEKRQPIREDGSEERARLWREQKKAEKKAQELAEIEGTKAAKKDGKKNNANATERKETLDKTRQDKTRELQKHSNPLGLLVAGTPGDPSSNPIIENEKDEGGNEDDDIPPLDIAPEEPEGSRPVCPHQKIIDLYHEILPANPRIKEWTPTRQSHLRARWNEKPKRQDLYYWKRFFEYIAECDFLVGKTPATQGKRAFLPGLDWLVQSANFTKIVERNYENR